MSHDELRLERDYRRLLRLYPRAWRAYREEELLSVLLQRAADEHRTRVSRADSLDLLGHAAEAQLDRAFAWLPWPIRDKVASAALVTASVLALLLLIGELIGAQYRLPGTSPYFQVGPVQSIGAVLYLGFLLAAALWVRRRAVGARLLAVLSAAYALGALVPLGARTLPWPRDFVLVTFVLLGLLSSLATPRTTRAVTRGVVRYGTLLLASIAIGVVLTRLPLEWSFGTMTTSGMVAFMALATALPFAAVAAVGYAAWVDRRRPGWLLAVLMSVFPVVVCCLLIHVDVTARDGARVGLGSMLYLVVIVVVGRLMHRWHRPGAGRSAE